MAIEDVTEIVPEVATITPFQKLVLSIGEIPTNYLDSMSYAEQVTWFCMFLQEKVLPVVNQHSEKILEIINYLNNLDLQEEVNTKLDEMVESGQLQEIIADYLNSKAVFGYDTVADMKSSTNLINGSYAKTLGYNAINDGGSALYKIRTITNEDVIDESTIISLNDNNLIAELIIDDVINSKQLGIIENVDVTNKLQKFFDLAKEHTDKEFDLMGGNYIISNTININPYLKIVLKGIVYITDNNETVDNIAFNIISDSTETTNDTQFTSYLFDNSNGSLSLNNGKTSISKIGISINSVSSSPVKRINANLSGIIVAGYDIGISLNTFNTYLMQLNSVEFLNNEIGLYVGKNGSVSNSGENISLYKCLFTRNNCCIYMNTSIKLNIEQSSFDFNSCVQYIPNNQLSTNLTYNNCWFEGLGQRTGSTNSSFNGFSGMIYAVDTTLWYIKNNVTITKSTICHLQGKHVNSMITGNSLLVTIKDNDLWFAENVMDKETIGNDAFNSLFLCNNVKNLIYKNNNFKLTSHPYSNKALSLTDALLENETTSTEYTTLANIGNDFFTGYLKYGAGQATGTNCRITTQDNKKCIELVPPYQGANSYLSIVSKSYYLIKDLSKLCMNGAIKGYKAGNHTFITFSIEFYDKDLNVIKTEEFGSNYRTDTNVDPAKWMFSYRQSKDCYLSDVPFNAVYFRPIFKCSALNGSFSETTIAGTTVTYNSPVYFTGFYTFME